MKSSVSFILTLGFLWMTIQSFQCSTPEFTAAKNALNSNDWQKAKELLEKEVARNKNNYEAWYYLGNCRKQLGDVSGMMDAYAVAEKGLDDKYRVAMSNTKFSTWAEMFNTSVELYNRYSENNDASKLDKGIETMNKAITLKSEFPENYSLLGIMYEAKGDSAQAVKSYEKYSDLQRNAVALSKTKGIYINMPRDKALDILGAPNSSKGVRNNYDSVIVDYVQSGGDGVYLYSTQKDKTGFVVEGWRSNPPDSWTAQEKERYAAINVRPFAQLGSLYYNRKEYDLALQYIEIIAALKPADDQATNLKVQIYQDQGKLEQAVASLGDLVRQDPKNKFYLSNYGMILARLERYDDAITQYKKALQLDPDYDMALFNAAAALKNRAGQFKKEEMEKREKDRAYKENEQRYFPLLVESGEYFDRYRKLPAHRDDMTALEQLVNIYEVVRDKAKLSQLVSELEGMEMVNKNNPRYWDLLGGVYTRSTKPDKADRAYKFAEEARKNQK